MNLRTGRALYWAAVWALVSIPAMAQAPRQIGTLVISGQASQAPVVQINGKSYVDLESLARITHGTLQFDGTRTILTLPAPGSAATPSADGSAPPRLTQNFLNAEIAALAQIREWHVAVVNAINNNLPITEGLAGPMRRQADAKLQLALAAATSGPDHQAADLLRNEFANMQQMSEQFIQMHEKAETIPHDVFTGNTLDAKIQGCQTVLSQMAASRQFQDDALCH